MLNLNVKPILITDVISSFNSQRSAASLTKELMTQVVASKQTDGIKVLVHAVTFSEGLDVYAGHGYVIIFLGLRYVYLLVLGLTSVAWFSGLDQWRFDIILTTWNRHYCNKLMHRCTRYWHGLPEIMTWISDYIHGFIWGVITYPCPTFSCGSTKLGHWWVITFHSFTWINLRD